MITFNKPYLSGNEFQYIQEAINSGYIAGNGQFTEKCQSYFEKNIGIQKALLTTSCTDALEMVSILLNIAPGDEIIIPSFTFVSTANAFVLRGAKIVFADSYTNHPNIDPDHVKQLISNKTKAIVCVHYGGVACDMKALKEIADNAKIPLIEDAAQAIDSFYNDIPLGSIGDFSTFSFHETKNIISGEGGLLGINNEQYFKRSEIIWEKGTNRSAFFRGEIDKYGWVDVGSSFLPSDIIAAFLWAQLESLEKIQKRRIEIWNLYYEKLKHLESQGLIELPIIPTYGTNNAHIFYMIVPSAIRNNLLKHLKESGVHAVFHYLPLHLSPFYNRIYEGQELPNSVKFSESIVRLPLYFELENTQIDHVVESIEQFLTN